MGAMSEQDQEMEQLPPVVDANRVDQAIKKLEATTLWDMWKTKKNEKLLKAVYKTFLVASFSTITLAGFLSIVPAVEAQIGMIGHERTRMIQEYGPTMGAEFEAKNGRALVVVHEGFNESFGLIDPEENEAYSRYLRNLDAEASMMIEDGGVVVYVEDARQWTSQDSGYRTNVAYAVTYANTGTMDSYFVSGEQLIKLLENAGVTEVVIGGENRGEYEGACATEVYRFFFDRFDTSWCETCTFDPGVGR